MAIVGLSAEIETPFGVTASKHIVTRIEVDILTNVALATVSSYVGDAANPIMQRAVPIWLGAPQTDEWLLGNGFVDQATVEQIQGIMLPSVDLIYGYVKKLPEFAEAQEITNE